MSESEDSNSAAEEQTRGSDAENPSSPPSPSSSDQSSPPQSPAAASQSVNSPIKSPSSQQLSSPESPASSQLVDSRPPTPDSRSHSPNYGPQSPDSGSQSPHSGPHSPESGPQSPSSPHSSKSSAPQSPVSVHQERSSSPQSENEVHISSPDVSDNEDQMDATSNIDAEPKSRCMEEEEEENDSSDRDDKGENESGVEENIPEINIESADEDDRSDKLNDPDNEEIVSDMEKEVKENAKAESDEEEKSENEISSHITKRKLRSPSSSPERSSVSPHQKYMQSENESELKKADKLKTDSDAEQNAESESDAESEESEVGGLIADIFGESDDDGEFEGFGDDEDIEKPSKDGKTKKEKKKRAQIMSDSEDEGVKEKDNEEIDGADGTIEDVPIPEPGEEIEDEVLSKEKSKKAVESDDSDAEGDRRMKEDFVSDFDVMMQKKKDESSSRRRRRDVDLISDSDDLIADIISQMRLAAEDDKELNKQKRTATKKLKILSMVLSQLKKQDLKMAFLDQGVLNVIAEWLTPLPDRSLPHLNIREGLLNQLLDLPVFDQSLLKSSGIGKAVMYLFKHPKETKNNRERASKLITAWSRPIFKVTTDYHSLTKEEREQRDYEHVPKKRKTSRGQEPEVIQEPKKDIEKELTGEQKSLRPGDKGWIGRARVPMPSTKDYVNRPKWNVETEFSRGPSKKPLSRIEKHVRALQEKKKLMKSQRAITISIEGRKMAI